MLYPILFSCLAIVVTFIIYRYIKVRSQNRKLNEERFERFKPLIEKLESGDKIAPNEILPYAENPLTRWDLYNLLEGYNQKHLFPEAYNSLVKSSESQLARWLEFPTELGACPDEMEYIKRVTIDFDGEGNFVHYEVFKFRMNEPHWAAEGGWSLGVVGPYFDDSQAYDHADATFSRISSKADSVSPEEEANWVHSNISLRRN